MAELVAAALAKSAERGYKSIGVEKHVDPLLDLGTLLILDSDDLDTKKMQSSRNDYILNLTRDNTQLLFNKIWELPTEKIDETIVVTLPEPTFVLPRAQKVPKPKPLTKWQQFAKDKGIQKKKKDKATWDEQLQKWVPLYGYKRAAAQKDKDWVLEVPKNIDPMTDMFGTKTEAKTEKVAKNELQRLKNIARAQKVKIPRVGFPITSDKATASQLATAVTVARSSTASVGKFQPRLAKEKEAHGKDVSALVTGSAKKRKAPFASLATEKQNNLNIVEEISRKKPKIDLNMAATKQTQEEQMERAQENKKPKPKSSKKGSKKGFGGPKGKKAGKPAAGKGQRNPSKRNGGRKRR